jgi:hypothetical protein
MNKTFTVRNRLISRQGGGAREILGYRLADLPKLAMPIIGVPKAEMHLDAE